MPTISNKEQLCLLVRQFLDAQTRPEVKGQQKQVTYIDLFCGGGGLSLGVEHALSHFGYQSRLLLAADIDQNAFRLFAKHFKPIVKRHQPIEDLVRYSIDLSGQADDFVIAPMIDDPQILQFKGKVDMVVGGPPCQGHSNLNNKTRRSDPRNLLYFTLPAFAIALDVPCIVIENIKDVVRAEQNVVKITEKILRRRGYDVSHCVLDSSNFGVAQTRKRHFMIASKTAPVDLACVAEYYQLPSITFDDINSNLPSSLGYPKIMETQSQLSTNNQERIAHLYSTNSFELVESLRPECHREGHTYPSVYGRLRGNAPAGTITTGFGSPGRGRYIHPHEPRMITLREAARVQSFPDWYFNEVDTLSLKRQHLQKIIGEAVPPMMVFPVIAALVDSFKQHQQKTP